MTGKLKLAEEHEGLIQTTLDISYNSFTADENEPVTLEMGFAAWIFDEREEESQLEGINALNADEGFKCPPSVLGWKLAELDGKEEINRFEVTFKMLSR